jgi:hypothetical protein
MWSTDAESSNRWLNAAGAADASAASVECAYLRALTKIPPT